MAVVVRTHNNNIFAQDCCDDYIEQLIPSSLPIAKIKMKVFGHSGVGKTTVIESLRAGYFSGLFRRSKRSSSSSSTSSASTSSLSTAAVIGSSASKSKTTSNGNFKLFIKSILQLLFVISCIISVFPHCSEACFFTILSHFHTKMANVFKKYFFRRPHFSTVYLKKTVF
jgi:GTPase SAR1 family protein